MADDAEKSGFESVSVLVPSDADFDAIKQRTDLSPFHDQTVDFVSAFSQAIMKSKPARAFPEIISLAHWMRKRAVLDLKERFLATRPTDSITLARGLVLHFAPGNVDTIFLYSALTSVLMGNRNVVRISSRYSSQIEILTDVLNALLSKPEFAKIRDMLRIVQYAHDDSITENLSAACDLRVIWGGDATVHSIRAIALPPRARDLTFPNRWSLAALDAGHVGSLDDEGLAALATHFVNDSYWFGQMACSSPRLVLWLGDEQSTQRAKKRYWSAVRKAADKFASDIAPVSFVNKLVSQNIAAIEGDLVSISDVGDNIVSVGDLQAAQAPDDDLCVGEGLFWQARIETLSEIAPVLDIQSQTLISAGIARQDWETLIKESALRIDRIVPFGQALQFGHIWDGVDLLTEFSRLVAIEV